MTQILNDDELKEKIAESVAVEDYDERLYSVYTLLNEQATALAQTFIQPEMHMAMWRVIDVLVANADWNEDGSVKPSSRTKKNGALAKAVNMITTAYNLNEDLYTPSTKELMKNFDFFRKN